MSQHNYTNPAFCQSSEFYPVPSAKNSASATNGHHMDATMVVESIYNRSLNLNFNAHQAKCRNPREGPLRIQRSMSTRSFVSQANATMRKTAAVPNSRQQQQLQRTTQQDTTSNNSKGTAVNLQFTTAAAFESRSGSGRYALVPVEELSVNANNRYAIVPGSTLLNTKRYAKSQDELDRYATSREWQPSDEDPHSFHEDPAVQFSSLPPVFGNEPQPPAKRRHMQATPPPPLPAKIKHAFSSDFGSKSFLIVDKHSNQRYQMVPTAEDEELVDDNQEIIQMHNGRAHRYAVIPTDDDEEETCLSTSDLNQSQNLLTLNYEPAHTTLRTSTPQKGVSMANLASTSGSSYPNTPLKNPAATKMLHELLSTPRKTPISRSANTTPRNGIENLTKQPPPPPRYLHHRSQQQIYYAPATTTATTMVRKKELSPQRLHYETIKRQPVAADRTMAVISPRVAGGGSKVYPQLEEEDCSDIHGKSGLNNNSYPEKVANATITLAVVSLMLVLGSTMNSGLIIYMIAHMGKSFYLQFSLVAAFCGVGLGFLGFRSRHCEWLPNRSYTSGYILVTMFCLLKCCGLLVILVLDPYPGLPLHDVTTGVILGLSTFTIFFIGLGVIGSLWCYRPPPDNRVNVV